MSPSFDISQARPRFPALQQDQVFLDNAGGSQALGSVIDSIAQYLSKNNVQLGASYHTGSISNTKYAQGYETAAKYINASRDEIVLGPSTTQLFMNLSTALLLPYGSTIILSKLEHETNVKPWLHLATRLNLTIKWWQPQPSSSFDLALTPENLKPLLDKNVSFVACTHVSNILGTIHDIKSIASLVHSYGALFCVDGVSYAPHRSIDVQDLGVDYYAFSWYKVYGPHMSLLYASKKAQEYVKPLNHYFNPTTTLEDKLGLAASGYEAVQALPEIVKYLGGEEKSGREEVSRRIAEHEGKLSKILLDFLNGRRDVTVYGSRSANSRTRVPTISFTVDGRGSREVVEQAEKISSFGFRYGHFYSKRLLDEVLGLKDREGSGYVVRVSMVHYNTEEEIRGLVEVLGKVLGKDGRAKL